MSFWRFSTAFSKTNAIDKILDDPHHHLPQILDEPTLSDELKTSNSKLISYLTQPDVIMDLCEILFTAAKEPFTEFVISEEEESGIPPVGDSDENSSFSGFSASTTPDLSEDDSREAVSETFSEMSPEAVEPSFPDSDADTHDEDQNDSHSLSIDEDSGDDQNLEYDIIKYSNIAADILSSEIWSISDSLTSDKPAMDKLWSILKYEHILQPNIAKGFAAILETLLVTRTHDLLDYINHLPTLVDDFLRHIDSSALMDFLLKLISSDKPDNPIGITETLNEQKLIENLLDFFKPEVSQDIQTCASDFIKAIVTVSANSVPDVNIIGPNMLTHTLVSEVCATKLAKYMLYGGASLSSGVGIIIDIIRKNNSDFDYFSIAEVTIESHPPNPHDPLFLGHLLKVITINLPDFYKLLIIPRHKKINTPFGEIEPLGFERFKICELTAELLHCSNMILLNEPHVEEIANLREEVRKIEVQRSRAQNESDTHPWDMNNSNYHNNYTTDNIRYVESLELQQLKLHGEDKDDFTFISKIDPDNNNNTSPTDFNDELSPHSTNIIEDSNLNHKDSILSVPNSDEDDESAISGQEQAKLLRQDPTIGDSYKIALTDLNMIPTILDFFFLFPFNNFIHNVVFDIIQQIINARFDIGGYNKFLAIDLFTVSHITTRIVNGYKAYKSHEEETSMRYGYLGHLTLIAEEVMKFESMFEMDSISPLIKDYLNSDEWLDYVDNVLMETRNKNNAVLGGIPPEKCEPYRNPDAIILGNGEPEDEIDPYREDNPIPMEKDLTSNNINPDLQNNNVDLNLEGEIEDFANENDSKMDYHDIGVLSDHDIDITTK